MKKFFKIMATVFVMVLLCGMAVSANSAITPTQVATGLEDLNGSPVYSYTYGQSSTYTVAGQNYVGGTIVPINVPGPGTLYFDFTENQSISTEAKILLLPDLNTDRGATIANAYSSTSLTNKFVKTSVDRAGTYYLVIHTTKYYISKLTSNTVNFRSYYVNAAYTATDQVIQSGQTLPLVYDYSTTRYYQISVPQAGHITVASNVKQYIDICNSAKAGLYTSVDLDPATNGGVASFYLEPGVYYIAAKGSYNAEFSALAYNYYPLGSKPYYVNTKEETVTLTPGSYQNYHYIMYKAPYSGYVTITTQGSTGYITLLKSNKKTALSSENYFNPSYTDSNRLTYGVKKGTTYYIRVKSSEAVSLNIKSGQIKEKSGSSKKKAVTVKRNKTVKGYIQAGSKTVDWYKFKVTKSAKTRIYLNGGTNDRFKITVYKSNGKSMGSGSVKGTPCKNTFLFKRGSKETKLAKGTYYIKIERYNAKSSGYYTLKWK